MELLAGISLAAIEQWGYYVESQNPTDYRYWSIPFTSHYITMATKTYYEPKEEAVPWLVGIDMQKFICGYGANFIGSSYVSCVGIGCQLQWGKILGDTVNLKIITFPVSFNECFGGLALFNGDPVAAAEYATITDITNTNFKIYMYANNAGTGYTNANIFYLFLGAQQQWGKTISGNNVKTKFPIAFTAFCMLSVSVNSSNGNAAESVFRNGFGYTNKTLSDWILRGPTSDATYFADYIAIGCQPQWGVGAASTNIMLPIPYTKVKFITLATSSMLNPSQGNISVAYHDSTLDSIRFQIRWQGLAAEYTGAWLTLGI